MSMNALKDTRSAVQPMGSSSQHPDTGATITLNTIPTPLQQQALVYTITA